MTPTKLALTLAAALAAGPALAVCPPPPVVADAAHGWLNGQRVGDLHLNSMADAACAYATYRATLAGAMGKPVGWKVGFTSKPAQEKFGVTAPVAGQLFADMIKTDGASVSMKGSRAPFFEADLIVTVKDAAINSAKTREEAAAALDEVVPFIEIPDMALTRGLAPTGLLMAAYGVMPWRGVEGTGVKIADLADPVADLAALTVDLKEGGKTVAEGKGEMLLGHPLDVVLWLVGQGVTLAPGDAISLGSLSALTPAKPGQSLSADYSVGGKTMHVAATLTE
ncbi:2-keto-4-pentenoate hydratase [Paracoccus sanguinis]|uniref:2-keto-4-pentenoate hydratase n=1 Tax=Paracoccus sanguinis TaxID=1545044 RepID=A0A1H2UB55_9RHOB|nr:hydratase [Paracoccus sanguinis]KGJ16727.1 hydratase [Paracoccus sanguinis]SDW53433.1 2-keto-4-pentenoate hydratase [Paracoccus sanguinis]